MEKVVTRGQFYLVVEGVGCREAIEDAAIRYVDIGKGRQFQRVS